MDGRRIGGWRRMLALAGALLALGLPLAAPAQGAEPAGGAPGGGARPQGPGPGAGDGPGASRGAPQTRPAGLPRTGAETRGTLPPMGGDRSAGPAGMPDGGGRTREAGAPVFGGPGGGFPARAPSSTSSPGTSRGDGSADTAGAKRETADASYRFRGKAYVRSQGGWYETRGAQRVPVAPPVGLVVDALPPDHETRWIDGVPYFVAGDAYFVWRERERKYQIVEPPAGALAPGLPELLPPVLPSGERPLGP